MANVSSRSAFARLLTVTARRHTAPGVAMAFALLLGACGGGSQEEKESCADHGPVCEKDVLTACVNGSRVVEDCSASGKLCYSLGGVASCVCPAGQQADEFGTCKALYCTNPNGCTNLPPQGDTCDIAIPLTLTDGDVEGTTANADDDFDSTCQTDDLVDVVYSLQVTSPMRVTIDATGSAVMLALRNTCTSKESELACNTKSETETTIDALLQVGTYYLVVDSLAASTGTFTLNISTRCPTGMISDGGGSCVDDPCAPNPCTADNKHVCTVTTAPAYTCSCDPGTIPDGEACEPDPSITGDTCADPFYFYGSQGSVTGSTTGADDTSSPATCTSSTGGADRIYTFTVNEATRADFVSTGYDTVMYLRTACADTASEIGCNDDNSPGTGSRILAELEPGTYFLFVDSYNAAGSYTLDYTLTVDPCAAEPCGAAFTCKRAEDWSSYECVCPAGSVPYNSTCVDNPCTNPNPCSEPNKNKCTPVLPSDYTCACNAGYIPDGDNCIRDPNGAPWTVMVYLNGDNNLEDDAYGDMAEMAVAGSSEAVNIIVLLDSATRDGGKSRYVKINQGTPNFTVLQEMGELDMSDWHTLSAFGIWAVENYPAQHYALFMWDHGSGWTKSAGNTLIKGFSNDDHGSSGGEISIAEGDYAKALEPIITAAGKPFDMLGFDACLMGMWEVAEASQPFGEVLVASEETEPGSGWNWDGFLPQLVANPNLTAKEIGTLIVDSYIQDGGDTLSTIDLTTLDTLAPLISTFADSMRMNLGTIQTKLETVVSATQNFYESDHLDLKDFATRVASNASMPATVTSAAAAVRDQLSATIAHNGASAGYGGAKGLAIYLPSYSVNSTYTTGAGAVWSAQTSWDEFLNAYAK